MINLHFLKKKGVGCWKAERERDFLSTGAHPQWLPQGELNQVQASSQELSLDLPRGCRDTRAWVIFYSFHSLVSRQLDGKWRSWSQSSVLMECLHGRWQLNLLCHKTGPSNECFSSSYRAHWFCVTAEFCVLILNDLKIIIKWFYSFSSAEHFATCNSKIGLKVKSRACVISLSFPWETNRWSAGFLGQLLLPESDIYAFSWMDTTTLPHFGTTDFQHFSVETSSRFCFSSPVIRQHSPNLHCKHLKFKPNGSHNSPRGEARMWPETLDCKSVTDAQVNLWASVHLAGREAMSF